MPCTPNDVFTSTDWKLLAQQKHELLLALNDLDALLKETNRPQSTVTRQTYLIGLLNWISAVQASAWLTGHPVVYLDEEGTEM